MRKIREVLRLYFAAALSIQAIAHSLGTSPSTVGEYLRRAKVAGVSWPVPEASTTPGWSAGCFRRSRRATRRVRCRSGARCAGNCGART